MTTNSPTSIEEALRLYQDLSAQPLRISTEFADLTGAIAAGQRNLVTELPWGERRQDEIHNRHMVIVKRVEGDRVYFSHGLKNPEPVGAAIEGPQRGPTRRVEPDGEESMDLATFQAVFARGGKVMVAG